MSRTFAGSKLSISAALPATYDAAGYAALTWTEDACSLEAFPAIEKTPSGVTEDLVCEVTSITKKGKSAWSPVTFNLYSNWANTVQGMLETAAASTSSVISVKLTFPLVDGDTTPDTVYFTCQVAKIGLTAGGSGDSHDMRPVELWIQSQDYTTVDAA